MAQFKVTFSVVRNGEMIVDADSPMEAMGKVAGLAKEVGIDETDYDDGDLGLILNDAVAVDEPSTDNVVPLRRH